MFPNPPKKVPRPSEGLIGSECKIRFTFFSVVRPLPLLECEWTLTDFRERLVSGGGLKALRLCRPLFLKAGRTTFYRGRRFSVARPLTRP